MGAIETSCIIKAAIMENLASRNIYVSRFCGSYYVSKELDGGAIDEPLTVAKGFEEVQDVIEIWTFGSIEDALIAAVDAAIGEGKHQCRKDVKVKHEY